MRILCVPMLAVFSGCDDHQAAMNSAFTKSPSERWMELRTRFHRYDAIAGDDKFRDFKIQFVALLEFLMYCEPTDKEECDGMDFFFPAFDKALEKAKSGGSSITYAIFMDTVGAIQMQMNELVEQFSRDLAEEIDHWSSLGTRVRIDALRGVFLTDVSTYLLLAGGEDVLAERTRLYPVSSHIRVKRQDNRFNFHGTYHATTMMRMCRRSNRSLYGQSRKRAKCLGLVVRVLHTYYTDRVLRTQNAPVVDIPNETEFYGLELSFQHAVEGYYERERDFHPDVAFAFLTALELLVEQIPADDKDKLAELADANREIHLFVATLWAPQS